MKKPIVKEMLNRGDRVEGKNEGESIRSDESDWERKMTVKVKEDEERIRKIRKEKERIRKYEKKKKE